MIVPVKAPQAAIAKVTHARSSLVRTTTAKGVDTDAQRRQRKAQTPQLALAESVQRSCVYAGGAAGGYARITENVEQSRQ